MTQPNHRPERRTFIVHVGPATAQATLPEWWGSIDSGIQARALRFSEDGGNWIEEQTLPGALVEAGARLTEVAGVMDFEGLKRPSLRVGQASCSSRTPGCSAHRTNAGTRSGPAGCGRTRFSITRRCTSTA